MLETYDPMINVWNEAASMNVFCKNHPLEGLRSQLTQQGIITSKELKRLKTGAKVRVTGILVIVHTPPTKSGKRVIFITMEDEMGLIDVVVFPKAQVYYAEAIFKSEALTVEGRLHRQGKRGLSASVIMDRLIMPWTGKLLALTDVPVESA